MNLLQLLGFYFILSVSSATEYRRTVREIVEKRQTDVTCNKKAKYRTLDGSCNNLNRVLWGAANTKLERFIESTYLDGDALPRKYSTDGISELPSARLVSTTYHKDKEKRSDVNSLMLMQWGQFLDHDITLTPEHEIENDCCEITESECFNILFSDDNHFKNRTCLPLSRSLRRRDSNDRYQQLNAITAFIDASNVYGSSQEELDEIIGANGYMLMDNTMLPSDPDSHNCVPDDTNDECFVAGDVRVNENPSLATMHTLFVREHNRIAERLREINPGWGPSRIFEETRKIVGAEMQSITYNEFLPIVLGRDAMKKYDLYVTNRKNYKYKDNVDPSIRNAFATAAYRFGHSFIPNTFVLPDGSDDPDDTMNLHDHFFNPTLVRHNMDNLVNSWTNQNAMKVDRCFSSSITENLFLHLNSIGGDLVARNIQRGRDHGLPPYNDFRAYCRLKEETVCGLFDRIPFDEHVYKYSSDIDLFTGGMSEPPVNGGLVGETFACLIGEQFKALKEGDRFFYLSNEEYVAFTEDQIKEISKMTLSKVICHNTGKEKIQKNVFFVPDEATNPVKDCLELDNLSLRKWKE